MSISLVQENTNGNSSLVNYTIAFSSNTTLNNTIIVVGSSYSETISGITDTRGNTYTRALITHQNFSQMSDQWCEIWYAPITSAGSTTLTISVTNTQGDTSVSSQCTAYEFSGIRTTSPVDTTNTAFNTNSSPVGASITPSRAGELILTVVVPLTVVLTSVNSPWTFDAPFVTRHDAKAYYINPPTTAQQAVFNPTTSQGWVSASISFLPPGNLLTLTLTESESSSDSRFDGVTKLLSESQNSSDPRVFLVNKPMSIEAQFMSDYLKLSPYIVLVTDTCRLASWLKLERLQPGSKTDQRWTGQNPI